MRGIQVYTRPCYFRSIFKYIYFLFLLLAVCGPTVQTQRETSLQAAGDQCDLNTLLNVPEGKKQTLNRKRSGRGSHSDSTSLP